MSDQKETEKIRKRYQRISSFYDGTEIFAEKRYEAWRPLVWEKVQEPNVLEVGVGTGKNMPHYPKEVSITGIDLTPGMLVRAEKKTAELNIDVRLMLGDIQAMDFPDESFDDIVATFVFCSVPSPVLGLANMRRMVKENGRILLLEHMRADNDVWGGDGTSLTQ